MSCNNSNCYLPQPPRAWSRVQNSCSLITNIDNQGLVKDPYTGQLVPVTILAERIAMVNKGNVLQYKSNSSNLTKSQKYSKIAKGQWVNRNTSWASQSTRGYTNPNTSSLKRSGSVVNIAIDPITGAIIGPTNAPPSCLNPDTPIYPVLPSNGGGGSSEDDPDIPPPVEPTPGSNVFPDIIPDTPVEPIVIQDGGNLICSIQENICTGETKSSLSQILCNPTTASDVPGPIQDLCWNDGTQTWYPRQRYIMTNSTNKWPVNAELTSAIQIYPPVIISNTSDKNIITLTWTFDSSCLPATNFNIYQDGIFVKTVSGNILSTTIIVENCNTYEYYIIAENITAKIISEKSNVVSISVYYVEPPINLSYTIIDSDSIELKWDLPNPNCQPAVSYNIYEDNPSNLIGNTSNTNFTVNGLINCSNYTFYVSSIDAFGNESSNKSIALILNYTSPPTNLAYNTTGNGSIQLTWNASLSYCGTVSYNIYQDNQTNLIGNTSNTNFPINSLTNCLNYTFYVSAINNFGNESSKIIINNVSPLWPNPPTNLAYNTPGSGSIELTWGLPNPNCAIAASYNVYQNNVLLIPSTTSLSYLVSGLTNCTPYTFSVVSVDSFANQSLPNTLTNVIPLWPNPPTNLAASWLNTNPNVITITWVPPSPNCSPPTSYSLYYSNDNINFSVITGITSSSTSYPFTPTSYSTYYFYMSSVNNLGESSYSPTVTASITLFNVSGGSYYTVSQITGTTTTFTIIIETGTTSLNFIVLPDSSYSNFQLVGAGGGGGGTWASGAPQFDVYSGAGGGGGGNLLINNFIVNTTSSYTVSVGTGGVGGIANSFNPDGSPNNNNTPGQSGQDITIIGTGINVIAGGGSGGEAGNKNTNVNAPRASGGLGGTVTIIQLSSGINMNGPGGSGGEGNTGTSWMSGGNGNPGYFYQNQSLTYSPSTNYPTYYPPSNVYTPSSVTLTEWYQVSGGGGGASASSTSQFYSYEGGSGGGGPYPNGGLSGTNYPYNSTPIPTPYPTFGGGGGGGSNLAIGFTGGNGLVVIWFSYTI